MSERQSAYSEGVAASVITRATYAAPRVAHHSDQYGLLRVKITPPGVWPKRSAAGVGPAASASQGQLALPRADGKPIAHPKQHRRAHQCNQPANQRLTQPGAQPVRNREDQRNLYQTVSERQPRA